MDDASAADPAVSGDAESLQALVDDIGCISAAGGFISPFKKDCTDLARRVSLLSYLIEEIRELDGDLDSSNSPNSRPPFLSDLVFALQNAKRVLLIARSFDSEQDNAVKKLSFQFQCVTWKLEKALASIPYGDVGISEDVQEQVELVRAQLKRATEKFGPSNSGVLSRALSQPLDKELESASSNFTSQPSSPSAARITKSSVSLEDQFLKETELEAGKSDTVAIPEDFLCPISLELMRDPVIVSTGQTYERLYIQRWIDSGNLTCPKTQQKLKNIALTPNYVLRSLISQWCMKNNVEQPTTLVTGRIRKSDGSFLDVSGDISAIQALVRKLTSKSLEDRRSSVREIRLLSKRNTDNRILIAEAGAIPVLVKLLTSNDELTQENAVTSILNLSIYENNKELIMLANAIPSIVQVLRNGTMEARENAAATLFSLSLADENKIIIGASGAVPALVELLECGSPRGKKDAATALFNLCVYQGNKGRAVRAGIIAALLKILSESDRAMVNEALTILSVLAGHQDAKGAIVKAGTIPVLVNLMRTGLPRNKENAAAILLALCKRDRENLGGLIRLGASAPLLELVKSGTERAKRKAVSLLEHMKRLQQQQ